MHKKMIAAVCISLMTAGCMQSPDSATRVLQDQGYKNIEITGYRFYGCSDDDNFHTGFKAVTPAGVTVTGVACSGWLSGTHIKID